MMQAAVVSLKRPSTGARNGVLGTSDIVPYADIRWTRRF
jgi:hypothetical protein